MILKGKFFDGFDTHPSAELSFDEKTGIIDYLEDRRVATKGAGDLTFLPGLIDTHTHFFGTGTHSLQDWIFVNREIRTIRSVRDCRALIGAGFTTVRTLGDHVSLGISKFERTGEFEGPRILSAGYSLAQTGGNDDPKFLDEPTARALSYSYYCDDPWECRRAVRLNVRNGAEAIKAYSSSSFVGGGEIRNEFTVEELSAIADEAHSAGVRAASHAYGPSAISNTIEAGFDSVEHGIGLDEELASRLKKMGMFYVPTLSTYKRKPAASNNARDTMIKKHLDSEVKTARDAGVKIAVGTDFVGSDNDPHGENYREVFYLSELIGGIEALRSATSIAADCIGLKDRGSLRAGLQADIIAVRGDPVLDPKRLTAENVVLVIKNGIVMKDVLSIAKTHH